MTPRLVRLRLAASFLALSTALLAQAPALAPAPAKPPVTDVKPNPDELIPSFKISGSPSTGS